MKRKNYKTQHSLCPEGTRGLAGKTCTGSPKATADPSSPKATASAGLPTPSWERLVCVWISHLTPEARCALRGCAPGGGPQQQSGHCYCRSFKRAADLSAVLYFSNFRSTNAAHTPKHDI